MKLKFGNVEENVVTREEFPLEKAREVLKDEVIAVIGYGVQGPGQALNLRDNGFKVIVGQRSGSKTWTRRLPMAGYLEKRFLKLRKPVPVGQSFNFYFPMQDRLRCGQLLKNT